MVLPTKLQGVFLSNFVRIGGRLTFAPPLTALVQTDATYNFRTRTSAVGAKLWAADGNAIYTRTWQTGFRTSSTEAEWISVLKGLEFAMDKEQDSVCIENDCLGVIHHLITQTRMKPKYAYYYEEQIRERANMIAWAGIRWIPREMNQADTLLR